MGLVEIFNEVFLPLVYEAGRCLFSITLISGVYVLIRAHNASESIKKIKTSTIGYFLLKSINSYIDLIDRISNEISF